MYKSLPSLLLLSMLLSACASESKLAVNTEAAEPVAVEPGKTVAAEAPPAVAKQENDKALSHLAAAPDFYHYMVNWSEAMQASLTPWTGAIKQCDTRESVK